MWHQTYLLWQWDITFVPGFYASLKFYTCVSLGVSVANNRAEIHKDWEWIEQNLMETLGGFIEQDSFFERYLTIEAILDSILNCKLVLLSSYQFESWDFWGMGGCLFMFIDDLYCMNYPLSEIYGTHPVPIYTFSFIMEQWIHGYMHSTKFITAALKSTGILWTSVFFPFKLQYSIHFYNLMIFILIIGSFENEEDATEFVKCKIESMFAHEHKTGEGK